MFVGLWRQFGQQRGQLHVPERTKDAIDFFFGSLSLSLLTVAPPGRHLL